MIRLGYLVPEFPGQTHAFFWREIQSLAGMGVECELISTRVPPSKVMSSHAWSQEAAARTTYLWPPAAGGMLSGVGAIIRSGPAGWWRVGATLARSKTGGFKTKVRLFGLAVAGGHVAAIARRRQWRHLHVHSCGDAAFVALFAQLVSGIPYSLTLHGPLADYGPNQPMKWSRAAFGVVITHKLLEEVRTVLGASAPPEIDIAPMGVNVNLFRRKGLYRPWNGTGPFRIFSTGRLNPAKGQGDLIRAVALLRGQGIDARLEIAGADDAPGSDQPTRDKLNELIHELNLQDYATLLGAVSEQEVREKLEASHVFALASLCEPLGVAIMEAMSMELPVVATRAGGVPEMVSDGVEGILVEPQNPADIARALERVARDENLAGRLACAGRKKIIGSYQSDRSAQALLRHLKQ